MKDSIKDYWNLNFTSEGSYIYLPLYLFPKYLEPTQENKRRVQERLRTLDKRYRRYYLSKVDPQKGVDVAPLLIETIQDQVFGNNPQGILKFVNKDRFKALLDYQFTDQAFHVLKVLWSLRRDSKSIGKLFQECHAILPQMSGGDHLTWKERQRTIRIHQAIYLNDQQLGIEPHRTGLTCYLKNDSDYKISITKKEFDDIKERYYRFFILFHDIIPTPHKYINYCQRKADEQTALFDTILS